jgi:four helix bundle protein
MVERNSTGGFERLDVYRLSEKLADEICRTVGPWDWFAKDTIGKQLVRATDSIGANIAEGSGRFHHQENRRFVRIARGSLYETRHWLRRAYRRGLLQDETVDTLKPLIAELGPRLNAYLSSIGRTSLQEESPTGDDPQNEDWASISDVNDKRQMTSDK